MNDMEEVLHVLLWFYIGKIQVSGQRWKKEVVHMAPRLVSFTKNKVKSNSYESKKLLRGAKGHFG